MKLTNEHTNRSEIQVDMCFPLYAILGTDLNYEMSLFNSIRIWFLY